MDFVKITDDFVEEEQEEQQVDDLGFIENNKFYNTMASKSTTNNIQNIQNKRVFPPQKLLDNNLGVKGGSIYNPNPNFIEKQQAEKKKVTYDDILSSLNMKVINGKLQIVRGDAEVVPPQQKKQLFHNRQKFNENVNMNAYAKQNEFYNKFLQAQTQAPIVAETLTPVVPFTPEEKKRILMMQYIKQQQERQHISRVKSRKLSFV
jgi:hypothetical protein